MAESNERVSEAAYCLDDIPEEERAEAIAGFFRTKDVNIAAYLKARGFRYRGAERVRLLKQRKEVTRFCFDGQGVTRRTYLEYYNNVDRANWNVNARLLFDELNGLKSIISNW